MKNLSQLLLAIVTLVLFAALFFISKEAGVEVRHFTKIDTIGHAVGFFVLTWILIGFFKLPLFNTVLCLFFYSALTELGQYYLGFRNGEFSDFIGDIVGVTLFAVIYWSKYVYGKRKPA